MFPELLRIPWLNIALPSYGVLLSVALISAFALAAYLAERDGLDGSIIYKLGILVLPAALLGTKLLALNQGSDVSGLNLWVGAYFGGLLLSLGVSVIALWFLGAPWKKIADASAPGLALGNVIGRLGCFAGGCCWGKPTTSWLGVMFTEKAHQMNGTPVDEHLLPVQLFQAGLSLLSLIFLLRLRKRQAFEGQVILCFLMLYSVERFFIDYLRDDPRGELFGLSTSQFISVILFPLSLMLMVYWSRRSANSELKYS